MRKCPVYSTRPNFQLRYPPLDKSLMSCAYSIHLLFGNVAAVRSAISHPDTAVLFSDWMIHSCISFFDWLML